MSLTAESVASTDESTDSQDTVSEQTTDEETQSAPRTELGEHETGHWAPSSFAALLAAGMGVVFSNPGLLLVGAVCVGLVAYNQAATPVAPELTVERTFSTTSPDPGDEFDVETTITNVSDQTLVDCRCLDLTPDELSVVDGAARTATVLRPGESCTLTYSVRARRGRHTFDGIYTIVSDLPGSEEHEYRFTHEDTITCIPSPDPLQATILRQLTTPYAGRMTTDKPGEGLEFHATREYRPGDSLRRIDWNQYASTGELATLQFRTERSASVLLVADVRKRAYVRSDSDHPHAADRALDAVGRLFVTLLENDHRAGIATLGPDFWFSPGDGLRHRTHGLEALGTEAALSPSAPEKEYQNVRPRVRQLLRRLPEMTQVIICSPLIDDGPETAVQMLESAGHDVTVISPDPTSMGTPGETVTAIQRRRRIRRIHEFGIPVVDWPLDQQLDVAIARTAKGWSE